MDQLCATKGRDRAVKSTQIDEKSGFAWQSDNAGISFISDGRLSIVLAGPSLLSASVWNCPTFAAAAALSQSLPEKSRAGTDYFNGSSLISSFVVPFKARSAAWKVTSTLM